MKKIIVLRQLPTLIKQLEADQKSIVLVGGVFDILHIGHIRFLVESKKFADCLMILLESDEKVKNLKGKSRPIHTQSERAEVLSQLTVVDYIVLLSSLTSDLQYQEMVTNIKPVIITATEGDPYFPQKNLQAQEIGAEIKIIPKIKTPSTTQLAKLLHLEKT